MDFHFFLNQIKKPLDSLQEKTESFEWTGKDSKIIVKELNKAVNELKEIEIVLSGLKKRMETEVKHSFPEPDNILQEISKIVEKFEREIELEKNKIGKSNLFQLKNDDNYSKMQEKLLAFVLNCRFYIARFSIYAEKMKSDSIEKKTVSKGVMELLEEKEKELQELRSKYSDSRKKMFYGYGRDVGIVELENDLNETLIEIEKKQHETLKTLENYSQKIEVFHRSYAHLKSEFSHLYEMNNRFRKYSFEIITELKKERDSSRKMLLEVENETLKLRNKYSEGLLNLEQKQIDVKKEAEEHTNIKTKYLKKELEEKKQLVEHFKNLAYEKNEKLKEIEKKKK